MNLDLNGFPLTLALRASRYGGWIDLQLKLNGDLASFDALGIRGSLTFMRRGDVLDFALSFQSDRRTRLRLWCSVPGQSNYFHLIPANIHGDNNAAHVRPGEFPVLATDRLFDQSRSPLWEFRADRSSHPVSVLCCDRGTVGISIDPYSKSDETDDGFIRNGVFAALPDSFGVSLGYGNDPLTFNEKTSFRPATSHEVHTAAARGTIFAMPDSDRRAAHSIIRSLYGTLRDRPTFTKSYIDAMNGLSDTFANVNYSPEFEQYTNRKCQVPVSTKLEPWRCIVEIGWTGGVVLAYPFLQVELLRPGFKFPKAPATLFDEICSGFNEQSGFIDDTCVNRFTKNRPEGWNASDINGWWSGFLPNTKDNHCAYNQGHAAYYLLKALSSFSGGRQSPAAATTLERRPPELWSTIALKVLSSAIDLQRSDGAFGYIFDRTRRSVVDYEGFAGCWFVPALVEAMRATGDTRWLDAARRAIDFYAPFIRELAAWGSPMDTCKSIDSEGNLAFIRSARLLHEVTGEAKYLDMLTDGANYEYLWRYGFRAMPQAAPLAESSYNCCGGSITSVSNPHIHPMSVIATRDLEYLAEQTGDRYHQDRADDGMAWLMNNLELYPDVVGYGQYGVLSERTCPTDGLLSEVFHDTNAPSSSWWSYNAWAAANALEAVVEQIRAARPEPR